MQIIVLFLYISQNLNAIQINNQEKKYFTNLIKRDVYSSSIQNLNCFTKTYENDDDTIIFNTPNFTFIDSLLSVISINKSKSSVRDHTIWLIHQITSNKYQEIARYDSIRKQFLINSNENFSSTIDKNTGQLTVINTQNKNLIYTEIIMHAQSGLSKDDDILHDIYRFIRLSTSSLNCTTNITINVDESIEIQCTIEYEFIKYEDLDNYQPRINFTFYLKQNDSFYTAVNQEYLNEINDIQIDDNATWIWKRSISYTVRLMNKEENYREYACIIVPDTLKIVDIFQDDNRICRTKIDIQNNDSSIITFPQLNQWNLIDIIIIILILISSLLLIVSLILCILARKYNKKRTIQIKPEILDKTITLPYETKQTFSKENLFSNNNEMKSEPSLKTLSPQQHKPGCPRYIPSPESNLLSSDLFTHTTIDNIKKIILPDIPQTNDLFDDQTYIHFYIPSNNENLSMKKLHSSLFEKSQSTH
ncbi:unnamed protein product [Adineta steineri]|uniref:Uncharacterized protein n=1 Tax=Adineta steineri TaxID=433720 RepID=A0A813Q281_9BILA|nr:unnamed protein product [Adineta steineri]CAF0768046.1 unnamed protein product [Adineta steineri]